MMTSDRAQIRKAYEQSKEDKLRLDNAVKAMLQHPDTRFYLNWLLEIGMVGQQPFNLDPQATSFNCGQLNVGNQILAHILEVDTDGYVLMRKEVENARRNRTPRVDSEPEPDADASDDA